MYTLYQEAKTKAALKGADDRDEITKKEGEWVGLMEIWRQTQLAFQGAGIKAPAVAPKAPEKIQQGQLTELQQIKKAASSTADWLKKIFEKEPVPATLG